MYFAARLVRMRLGSAPGTLSRALGTVPRARVTFQLPIRSFAAQATVGKPRAGRGTSTTRSKTGTTKKAAKKPVKKAKAKAKPKKKAAPKKKVLTEKQKEARDKKKARDEIKELKEKALSPPKSKATAPWPLYVAELRKGKGTEVTMQSLSAQYKQISPSELEQYNHEANQNKAEYEAAYTSWIQKHSPEEIRLANNARKLLRRRLATTARSRKFSPLKDDRQVKGPQNAYSIFFGERAGSGDFRNIKVGDTAKLISTEWKELSGSEKKKYEDLKEADHARYVREYSSTYGRVPVSVARAQASG